MSNHPAIRIVATELEPLVERSELSVRAEDAGSVVAIHIGRKDREHFVVLHLNAQNLVTGIETVAIGELTTARVHPREVFKGAICGNAAAIIVGHNHPSGDLTPSSDDKEIHRHLRYVGVFLGIPVLDFVIVHGSRSVSLAHQS